MVIQRHNHMMNIEHAIPITPHSQGSENITDTQKTVNPYCQILENISKNRVVTQRVSWKIFSGFFQNF